MSASEIPCFPSARGGGRFPTTHWSVVLAAGLRPTAQSRWALETLCRSYRYPLYAYLRRRGTAASDAQDLVQEFFAWLLEKNTLSRADRHRGRFRTFLLTVFQRFLAHQRERAAAEKRGGTARTLSLDIGLAEESYRCEPFHELTAERIYERRWALTVLDQALARLQAEWSEKGKAALFDRLKVYLTGLAGTSYQEAADALGMTPVAVKVAVHRLRHRYRQLLRDQIAQTVADPEEKAGRLCSHFRLDLAGY